MAQYACVASGTLLQCGHGTALLHGSEPVRSVWGGLRQEMLRGLVPLAQHRCCSHSLEKQTAYCVCLARLSQWTRCVQGRGTGAADRLRLQQAQVCAPEAPAGAPAAAAAAAASATSEAAAAATAACARLQAAAAA